jgi:hypothetical protein
MAKYSARNGVLEQKIYFFLCVARVSFFVSGHVPSSYDVANSRLNYQYPRLCASVRTAPNRYAGSTPWRQNLAPTPPEVGGKSAKKWRGLRQTKTLKGVVACFF